MELFMHSCPVALRTTNSLLEFGSGIRYCLTTTNTTSEEEPAPAASMIVFISRNSSESRFCGARSVNKAAGN